MLLLLATTPRMAFPGLEISAIHHAQLITDETGERMLSQATDMRAPPGAERLYTLHFINTGDAPAAGLVLEFPLPAGLGYAPASATGPGAVISLSVDDGASFARESDLGDRASRATHLRWSFAATLYPQSTGIVSFRGRILPPPSPPAEALPRRTEAGGWPGLAAPIEMQTPSGGPGSATDATGTRPADGSITESVL